MKTKNYLAVALTVLILGAAIEGKTFAQNQQAQTNRMGGQPFSMMDFQNMDPQQIQKMIEDRMMESYRERLEVTDDAEWKVLEERIKKVMDARRATMSFSGGMGMMGMMGGRGGGGFPGGGGPGAGRFQSLFGEASPETEALQKAVDAKAPVAEIKARLAKLEAVRAEKRAALAKAQDELRQLLTPRQEASAVLVGLLD